MFVLVGAVLGWCLFDVVYILCLLLASSVVIYIELTFVYCVSCCCFMFYVVVVVEGDGVTKCARRIGDGDKAKSNRLRVY